MNLPPSVTNTQHGHPGQKALEHLAQLQQHNALLKESPALTQKALALSQKDNALQEALTSLAVIEEELLLVLEGLSLPLHNHLSESLIREYVKRRKISGGMRSAAGRQSRDTFASLKKTCRLYDLSFRDYLTDRLKDTGLFPKLGRIIGNASLLLPCSLSKVAE